MEENTICEQCGGVKNVSYTFEFVECKPHSRVDPPPSPIRALTLCPGHPEQAKHDGTLDENYRVYQSNGAWSVEGMILEYKGTCQAIIRPKQALSLLVWLTQEKPTLEQLAKEQEE